ncbi:GRP family sugar transporter [Larkinella knui]|uniref:Multidrug DMT transporter permease n=1 Tax=Larkinella knui TaxID=2025310 RepID=A0A3P1CV54_9BACT|nr:GRP family sugar transporter [Larkinella knui]RRB17242.1 multidrug DMT transporter permease [Larkinella knui]
MFIIPNYTVAVVFCLITMLCWGSWANTQKLAAGQWRFELFYWDYVIGIFLFSLLSALTLGSIGEGGRPFLTDIAQADKSNMFSAILGGVIFNASNILLAAAISISGMAVAFPVGVGLALVIGVIINYINAPVGNASILLGGVVMIVVAILLNAKAYRTNPDSSVSLSRKGLWLAIISGGLMGLFYKYVAQSMFPDFQIPQPGKLSPYSAVVFFSIGVLTSNFLFNTLLMWKPFIGEPLRYANYFRGGSRNHAMGILGGTIWCIGLLFSIIASDKAGPAISYGLGQGATVIAAIWGIYVWREFRHAPQTTHRLLNIMLLCYVAGLSLLIIARDA